MKLSLLHISCFILLFCSSPVLAINYSIEKIASLTPGNSWKWDINESGQVVGWDYTSEGYERAFVYTPGSGVEFIGTLGGDRSLALAINDNGVVMGGARTEEDIHTMFSWTESSGMIDIFPERAGATYNLNNSGNHVGHTWVAAAAGSRAYTYINGEFNTLDTFGGTFSVGQSINESNVFTGHAFDTNELKKAYICTDGSTLTPLGTLGGDESVSFKINDNNQIVGWSNNSQGDRQAFIWEAGTMTSLTDLGGGDSNAASINNNGVIVGYSKSSDNEDNAVMWLDSQIYNLNDFLPEDSDWSLDRAHAINELGQIVVVGSEDGVKQWFILTPTADVVIPEPATLLLLFSSLIGLKRKFLK